MECIAAGDDRRRDGLMAGGRAGHGDHRRRRERQLPEDPRIANDRYLHGEVMSLASYSLARSRRVRPGRGLAAAPLVPLVPLVALIAAALVVIAARPALAQETTGRIVGVVTDEATHTPQGGVTVILWGSLGQEGSANYDRGAECFVNHAA